MRAHALLGLAGLALTASCAAGPTEVRAPHGEADSGAPHAKDAGAADGSAEAAPRVDPLPTLEALASGAVRTAPAMRELARRELDVPQEATRIDLFTASVDTCVRVRVVGAVPLRASLETAQGAALADAPPGVDVALAERGPVCVRRGDRVTLVLAPREPGRVRFVAWVSP